MNTVICSWVGNVTDNKYGVRYGYRQEWIYFDVYHRLATTASGVEFFYPRGGRIMRVSGTMISDIDAGFI